MFSFFKSKEKRKKEIIEQLDREMLHFKSNETAFEYATNFYESVDLNNLSVDKTYFGRLCEDYLGNNHPKQPVVVELLSSQGACLGVFMPKEDQKSYPKNTLIYFMPKEIITVTDMETSQGKEKFADTWVGVVTAILEPSCHPKHGWLIREKLI